MKNRNSKLSTGRLSWMLSDVFKSKRAEGYVDTAVKVLIAVVIGALLLFGLYGLVGNVVIPTTTSKVSSLFNTTGVDGAGTGGGTGGTGGGGTVLDYSNMTAPEAIVAAKSEGKSTVRLYFKNAGQDHLFSSSSEFTALFTEDVVNSFGGATEKVILGSDSNGITLYNDPSADKSIYIAGSSFRISYGVPMTGFHVLSATDGTSFSVLPDYIDVQLGDAAYDPVYDGVLNAIFTKQSNVNTAAATIANAIANGESTVALKLKDTSKKYPEAFSDAVWVLKDSSNKVLLGAIDSSNLAFRGVSHRLCVNAFGIMDENESDFSRAQLSDWPTDTLVFDLTGVTYNENSFEFVNKYFAAG